MTTIEGLRDHPLVDAFVRTDALQCGFCTPGQIVSASALVAENPDPSIDEIRHQMAGNLCRCGTYPRSRRRSSRGAPDQDRERGRRPLHRDVGRRRGGRARPWPAGPREVVGRPAAKVDGYERARGEARFTSDVRLPGMLEAAYLRSPHAHAQPEANRPNACERGAGRARRAGRGRGRVALATSRVRGTARCGARRRHSGAGARGARPDRRGVGRPGAAARSGRGGTARIAHRRGAPLRARRLRARPRRGGRRRRGRVPDADAQPQLAGDPPVRLRLARRRPRRLHLDAVHLGRPRRGRASVRPGRRQGARRLRVHGRRLRLESLGGRLHAHRGGARAPHGSTRALRDEPARGEHGRRQPQRDDSTRHCRCTFGRHAHRARRRVLLRARLERLVAVHRRTDADAPRVRERAHRRVRREAEPSADGCLSRARLRRGDVVARVPARQARGRARPRPARGAPPQLRER